MSHEYDNATDDAMPDYSAFEWPDGLQANDIVYVPEYKTYAKLVQRNQRADGTMMTFVDLMPTNVRADITEYVKVPEHELSAITALFGRNAMRYLIEQYLRNVASYIKSQDDISDGRIKIEVELSGHVSEDVAVKYTVGIGWDVSVTAGDIWDAVHEVLRRYRKNKELEPKLIGRM